MTNINTFKDYHLKLKYHEVISKKRIRFKINVSIINFTIPVTRH